MTSAGGPLDRVAVLIVNYNAGGWLARCVAALRPAGEAAPAIRIVDNGSSDDSLERLDAPGIEIDRAGRNLGFAAGINRAAAGADAEFLLLLNPDCRIEPAALIELVGELDRHPGAALVSCRVLDDGGREQRGSRRRLPTPRRIIAELAGGDDGIDLTGRPAPAGPVDVEAVSGACMLVRRSAFEQVGGMEPAYPLHFEDLDLFARLAEAGWTLRWTPAAEVVHAGGRSTATRPVAVLWAKHRGLWIYLRRHCSAEWPRWQRPAWAVALTTHALLKTPVAWFRARRERR